jgi:hypothetical protein
MSSNITKELIDEYAAKCAAHKAYQATILPGIHQQIDEIWKFILKSQKRKLSWYAFQNDDSCYNHSGSGSDGGEFDPITDIEYIEFQGDFGASKYKYANDVYETGFPTELLWNKFYEADILEQIKLMDAEESRLAEIEKTKKAVAKTRKQTVIENIKSKLTAEEIKLLKSL